MAQDDPVRLDTRIAGQLRRYHTWPIIGQQTIAEHSWQLMRIYMCVVDKLDIHMIRHIQFHDIGEHFTGDIPYPVKHDNPKLKELIDSIEMRAQVTQLDYWNSFHPIALTDQDRVLFKQIELTEMAEFGLDQMCLGNNHGYIIADRCLQAVYQQEPCPLLVQYVIRRLQIFFKQCSSLFIYKLDKDWWLSTQWEKLHESK